MSWPLLTTLFAIQGLGLAVLSATCLILWRQVRAMGRAERPGAAVVPTPTRVARPTASPAPARPEGSPPQVRYEVARRLDELTGRHRSLEARLARVEASATEAAIAIASRPARRVDRGGPASSGGPTLIAVPDLAAPPAPATGAAAELDRRFGDLGAMADAGMPPEVIARETGQPIGQVELILGLRRRAPAAEAGPDA